MRNLIFFYLLVGVLINSCTWDLIESESYIPCIPHINLILNVSDTCFELSDEFDLLPLETASEGFGMPRYNPLNKYEIIVGYGSDTTAGTFYKKIDLCEGVWDLTYHSTVGIGQPDWSISDWILLGYNGPVYKMKSNGDSLTYLNEIAGIDNLYRAIWIDGGQKIFCYAGSPIGLNVILDKNGIPLDTLPYKIRAGSCFGNKIAGYRYINNNYTFCTYDVTGGVLTDIAISPFTVGGSYNITSVDWLNESEIIWTDNSGIHKVNLDGNITTLKSSCGSKFYYCVSSSPDHNGDFLVGRDLFWVENDTARFKVEILKINAYTGEEWILNLEQ